MNSSSCFKHLKSTFEPLPMPYGVDDMLDKIVSLVAFKEDEKLWEFFEPYLRQAGVKGEITKGKLKCRGIKLKVENNLNNRRYQLCQRGVDISPVLDISFNSFLRF